jgi:ribonucleoside-diphosphate reductase alpha chain
MDNLGLEILSELTIFTKYAKYKPELKRRETWDEIVDRYIKMMVDKYPQLEEEIIISSELIKNKKVLPSMRMLQFAGLAIDVNNARGYNCFRKDTKFITSQGLKSFNDFKNGDEIIVMTHNKRWKKAIVRNYGKQSLLKLTFKKGRSEKIIYATENHRWLLRDKSETIDLKIGSGLFAVSWFNDFDYYKSSIEERLMWAYGYVYGDGTLTKNNKGEYTNSLVRLCKKDNNYLDRFVELGFKYSSPPSFDSDAVVYTGSYLKTLPDSKIESPKNIRAFARGYLDADGAKNTSTYNVSLFRSIQITKPDKDINKIIDILSISGFFMTGIDDYSGQKTNFGIRPNTKRIRGFTSFSNSPNCNWYLRYKEQTDIVEDVWCLEVEEDCSFILDGGLVTGNCSYTPIDSLYSFSEIMFLLLGGTGVGFSVQKHHIEKLPTIRKTNKKTKNWLIEDSIMGWADAVKVLMKAYLNDGFKPKFDFRAIRPKGSRLITAGGKAPGSEPLKICLAHIEAILDRKNEGEKLTPLECHDIICHIANSVLAGGIRRSACISIFSIDDDDMLTCKYGNWWELNEQRGRANNTILLERGKVTKEQFDNLWKRIELSGSGEPGVYWTNDKDLGFNPCVEISLKPYQFCNLCEVNVSDIENQKDLNERVKRAAFFGTLQAGFTNFHYLRDVWKETTEEEALLGVSMTGIGSGKILNYNLTEAANIATEENGEIAEKIGIKKAARVTCIKPAGTTSLVLKTSSGIHAWHNDYYLRTMRFNKNEEIAQYLMIVHPELCEDDVLRPHDTVCIRIPVKAPEGSILRTETAIDTLERVKKFYTEWIKPGHISGANTHNVSATISIDKNRNYVYAISEDGNTSFEANEWIIVGEWMWNNREFYNGLSVLPYSNHTYTQAPFEEITKEQYEERVQHLKSIDLSNVIEMDDTVNFGVIAACSGGSCEINI